VERVLRIGEQIAKALVAAHQIGIVHRDLKPPNVMILQAPGEEPDLAKVLDFGIARPVFEDESKLTSTGMVLGTPQYMSPEQAQGEKVGPPSDVYNLGLILYRALTGELAIRGRTPVDYLRAHVMDVPTPLQEIPAVSGLPRVLADVIMRCLAKDATARPTAQEVVEALRAHRTLLSFKKLTGTTPTVEEPDDASRQPPAAGTSRLVLAAVAAGVLFALILGGVLLVKPKTGAPPQAPTPPASAQAEPAAPTATQPPTPVAKETLKAALPTPTTAPEPAPDLVSLPTGTALVLEGDKNVEHSVPAFRIERDEVTATKYAECVAAKACASSFLAGRAEYEGADLPVVGITPEMASVFCAWRGRRLPSRAEWIRAARGERDLPWPVDPDKVDLSRCCNLDGAADGFAGLAPVGRLTDVSPSGVRDLTGNVSEWIQASGDEGAGEAMGGSWKLSLEDARVDVEHVFPPGSWFPFVGFRCAADEAKP
jgi:formylglycine-generating enzyme required for sulfatase activity